MDTSLGQYLDSLIYGSHYSEEGSFDTSIDLYSLTVCPSGQSRKLLPKGESFTCSNCGNLLYSDGFSECRDCFYWNNDAPLS